MLKAKAGDNVAAGFYWNVKEWEAKIVPPQGGVLKGDAAATFVRLPFLALIVLAPLMGAAYAFFLPFIGFAMVLTYLAGRVRGMFTTTPPAAEEGSKAAYGVEARKKAA